MLKRFISYYKPHRKMLALDMLASLLISLIGMVYPIVTNKMLNVYIPEKMYSTIVFAGLLVLALYFVRMLMRYFVQYYGHLIGVKMQSRMRQDLFAHLEKLPFSFYESADQLGHDPALVYVSVQHRLDPDAHCLLLRADSGCGDHALPQGNAQGV